MALVLGEVPVEPFGSFRRQVSVNRLAHEEFKLFLVDVHGYASYMIACDLAIAPRFRCSVVSRDVALGRYR